MIRQLESRQTRIVAIGNQKGGVGKTTCCVHLAAALGELGKKCLVWDLDGNAGLTRHFGIPEEANFMGTYEILTGAEQPADVIITGEDEEDEVTLPKNVHLIPAGRNLENIEIMLREKDKFISPRDIFVQPVHNLEGKYDYILLDTAPNAGMLTIATYLIAEWFILAAIPEHLAIESLRAALDDIKNAQARSARVALLGVVLSSVNKQYRTARILSEIVHKSFTPNDGGASLKFETEISRSVAIPRAQADGKTLFDTEPNHKVTEQYRQLGREVERRLKEFDEVAKKANEEVVVNG